METTLAPPEATIRTSPPADMAPPAPASLSDTGLSQDAVIDLVAKLLYVQGARTGQQITEALCLPFEIVDDQLLSLQQRRLLEVRGTTGPSRGGYVFDLTATGRERAREAMEANQYVGPAPVPLEQYRHWVGVHSIRNVRVTREVLVQGLQHVVLKDEMLDMLGPAVNSARSLFLYGDPGNGKTLIAEAISRLLGGAIYMPYAVDIGGQIMVTYDPVYHRAAAEPEVEDSGGGPGWLRALPTHDRRYARIHRPVVITGGELTLEQLDLRYDPHTRMYQAPFQVKANGGVLIIDDFGRQRVPARDLLNRWIVPLEKQVDYLTLYTGAKFPVPFDCLVIFSTNLDPVELAEEAFWRRIPYKAYVSSPAREEYEEIFRRCCAERGIEYDPAAIDRLYARYYHDGRIPPRGCHPRDLLNHLCDSARFLDTAPELTPDLIDRAAVSYFIEKDALTLGAAS
jgi:predicted ATPase with chaperone activity